MDLAAQKNHQLELGGRRLVIVSNRLPFNVSVDEGRIVYHPSAGGLITGLASFREARKKASALPSEHLWVGWPGHSVEGPLRQQVIEESLSRYQSYPVFLSEAQMDQFYLGFGKKNGIRLIAVERFLDDL